ncbi:hypothetical protein HMI55_003990 [Coelomomyces lativittatus]|nr:hypothetical protein HMI55_003990 [Coelomomyces lativittatus]
MAAKSYNGMYLPTCNRILFILFRSYYKASPASYSPILHTSNPIPKFSTNMKDESSPDVLSTQIGPGTYSIEPGYQKLSKFKQPTCPKWHASSANAPLQKLFVTEFYDIQRAEKAMQVLSKRHRLPKLHENGHVDWV